GPGLPRDPPSASTITFGWRAAVSSGGRAAVSSGWRAAVSPLMASQTGFLGAHQHGAALRAPHHGLRRGLGDAGDLAAVELDPAGAAATGLQQRRADTVLGALAVVDGEQLVREGSDQ